MKNINLLLLLTLLLSVAGCKKDDDDKNTACTTPTVNVSTANLQANITANGSASATYEVEYGLTGFAQGSGTSLSGSNAISVTVSAGGVYDFYTRANCGSGNFSEWVLKTVTLSSVSTGTPKLKTYKLETTNGTPVTTTYTYNSDGRLASELTDVNSGVYYAYSGNKITSTGVNGDTLFVYTTNSDGYAVIGVDPANTYTYQYNSDWNMTNNNGNVSTWGDGNRLTANNGVNVYTYFTDKTNTIGTENRGQKYFGVDSKNLVKTLQFSNFSTTNYTYEFDTQNRVTKRLTSNSTETYTYY